MPDSGTPWRGRGPKLFDRALARVALALAIGISGAVAASVATMPLPYLLGPLLACAAASILSAPISPIPYGRELGQVAVGLAIGLRFIPTVVIAIITMLPFMLAATILMIVATMIAAFMISKLAALDLKSAFFATAAAGLAEMAVVAHQKGADSDTVAVVHLIRVTSIVTIVPFLVTIFGMMAISPRCPSLSGLRPGPLAHSISWLPLPGTWQGLGRSRTPGCLLLRSSVELSRAADSGPLPFLQLCS